MENVLKVKGVKNIRYVPQYIGTNGKKVKNCFIRSGRLDKAPRKKLHKFLQDNNVKAIYDFRTPLEIAEGKNCIYPEGVIPHRIPLINESFFGITHEKKMSSIMFKESRRLSLEELGSPYMINMYKSIVFDSKSQVMFRKFFDSILEYKEGTIIYHCAGGKDRTGIASLFILSLLGVKKEDIIADYAMSDYLNRHYNRSREFLIKLLIPFKKFRTILISMLHARKEYIEKTIETIEEKYGSVVNYLYEEIKITKEEHKKIQELFLV